MAWKTVQEIRDALADINDPAVDRLDIEVRPDSTGEPAVFVTVVFRDADLREGWLRRNDLRASIRARLVEFVPELWPFVWFSAQTAAANPYAARAR